MSPPAQNAVSRLITNVSVADSAGEQQLTLKLKAMRAGAHALFGITSVDVSRDGSKIATGDVGGGIKIWDSGSTSPLRSRMCRSSVARVATGILT